MTTQNDHLSGDTEGSGGVAEILSKAADLIQPKGAWLQGALAKMANGLEPRRITDPSAVSFCALGALIHAAGPHYGDYVAARDCLHRSLGRSIVDFNNAPERTRVEVVTALRDAAALARAETK